MLQSGMIMDEIERHLGGYINTHPALYLIIVLNEVLAIKCKWYKIEAL